MSFSVLPPELNSALMFAGPGAAPLLAAAEAWDGIGAELNSAASTFSSVTSDLTAEAWQGPASLLMKAAAGPYAGWLGRAAAQAEESASQARAAAAAFEAARGAVVDPGLVTANRGQLVSLVISNLFGENAPAIAATEAAYEQMWAHDVAVMSGYHTSASATVAQLGQWGQALENLPGLPGEFAKAIQQTSATPAAGPTQLAYTLLADIVGSPALPAIPASQNPTFTGTPSLLNRFEVAGLWGIKGALSPTGIEAALVKPGSPFLSLVTGDSNIPGLSFFLSNTPPKVLPFLFGETVQQTTFEGMRVVEITPAHPSGDYVVAIHGGAFIFAPSIFHWLDYTLMASQTGATIEVPIYPLLQQSGTAETVVPVMANYIAQEVGQYGSSHVSVIGDSAGGNLALASTEYLVAHNETQYEPGSMVLLSPWLDVGLTNPNIGLVHDPLLPVGPGQVIGKAWAGDLPENDYEVSPLYGSLDGLPPTYVYSGSLDSLAPDVVALEQNAATTGAPFSFVLATGEIHDWVLLSPDGPRYLPQIEQELGI
ncbi:PPE family protein [Mycobacterium sp.]|uniref:triacylglycerol lipase LipY n=1 Tax=Mycobacterium sp. TaxID=1785 RepID=UPI002C73D974|nr:PPE family protein [Mycobacterium sp.]HTQ19780.1 PPE family protein [Mycobacterium sp.]